MRDAESASLTYLLSSSTIVETDCQAGKKTITLSQVCGELSLVLLRIAADRQIWSAFILSKLLEKSHLQTILSTGQPFMEMVQCKLQ